MAGPCPPGAWPPGSTGRARPLRGSPRRGTLERSTESPSERGEAGAKPALSRNCKRGAADQIATGTFVPGRRSSCRDPQARRPARRVLVPVRAESTGGLPGSPSFACGRGEREVCLVRTAIATSALLVVTLLLAPGAALAAPDPATAALAYLAGQQAPDGSIASSAGVTEDVILGTTAANYDPNTLMSCAGRSAYGYLTSKLTAETATAGGTGKLILAVLAGKLDPTAFGGQDLIAHLGTFLHGTTGAYGDGSTFGQSLAILALKGAGHAIPVAAVTELEGLQDTDGSWNYQATSNSVAGDTNSTAIAVEALTAAGISPSDGSMTKAIAYLHTQ